MKLVRVFSLVKHVAVAAAVERALCRGDKVIAMCRREEASRALRGMDDIIYISSRDKGFFDHFQKECEDCDYIILQSIAEDFTFALKMLQHPKLLKKCVWLIAGGDLYDYEYPVKGGLRERIGILARNAIATRYRKRIPYAVCSAIDAETYKKTIGNTILVSKECNLPGFEFPTLDENKPDKTATCPLRILVGHSCVPNLRHREVLQQLKKLDLPHGTRILLPMSYGKTGYGDEVEREAKKLFGENAEVLREHLQFPDYVKLLWTVDCAVFHTERQIALGNLLMLFYMKKKVFLPRDSVMSKFFRARGVPVFDSDNLTAEQLLDGSTDLEPEKTYALRVNDKEAWEKEQDKMFEEMEKRLEGEAK